MKYRPLLMCGSMVRSTLADLKTNTRRLNGLDDINADPDAYSGATTHGEGMWCFSRKESRGDEVGRLVRCPYGQPGDHLWVRETWRTGHSLDTISPKEIARRCLEANYRRPWAPLYYEADGEMANTDTLKDFGESWGKTRVSIHMPRWASRITLEITGIRVERLWDISETDARAEGIDGPELYQINWKGAFARLWDSINGDGSWLLNPHVWVLTFKRVTA